MLRENEGGGADKALLVFGFRECWLLSLCLSENSAKTECIMSDWKGITQTKLIYWCELHAEELQQGSLSLAAADLLIMLAAQALLIVGLQDSN